MGQDIHIKTFLWSKVEKKYIDGMSLSTCPQYSACKPFFDGRYYDFFSLFGSGRGSFKELSGGNYGIPDFTPKTYKKYLEKSKCDYHSFVWYDINTLKKSLLDYVIELKDPKLYYKDIDESMPVNEQYWKEDTEPLISTIQKVLKNLQYLESEFSAQDSFYGDLVDASKTVFLIYFDN